MPIVTSHAIAVHSQYGGDASRRLQKAMEDAVLQCNQEGIANTEENAGVIRRRMRVAYQSVLLEVTKEQYAKQLWDAEATYRARRSELDRAHNAWLSNAESAHASEMAFIEASIFEAINEGLKG